MKAGVAREQARKDLPLATYTEAYWKIELHNLLHFLSVRMDQHTQLEIRSYANVIGNEIVSKWCPITWESFLDYQLQGRSFYKHEMALLKAIAAGRTSEARQVAESLGWLISGKDGWQENRERKEFEAKATELGVPIHGSKRVRELVACADAGGASIAIDGLRELSPSMRADRIAPVSSTRS